MNVRYRVMLTQYERHELGSLLSGGKQAVRKLKRAQILVAADAGLGDEEIAASVGVGGSTVYRTKRRFVEGNLGRALSGEPRPGAERKLTGKEEALLVATACSSPPAGRARWTLELLADAMVKLTAHESLSRETVRRRLAENDLKPWRKKMWCIPQVDADYVARMEDVLDLYAEPPDPQRPVVCFDESPIQLIGEVRQPIPPEPGQLERYDCEYQRNGTANPVRVPRREPPLAQGEGHRTARRGRLRRLHARTHRRSLSFSGARQGGPRQSVDPFGRRALPDIPGRRSGPDAAPARVPLRPQACQLAQHGRDRDRRPRPPMPRPSHRQLHAPCRRDRRMGEAPQCRARPYQLDVHNRKGPRPNGTCVSKTRCHLQEPSTRHCRIVEERPASPSIGIIIGGTGFAVRTEAESRMRTVEQCRETSGSGSVIIEEWERLRAPN